MGVRTLFATVVLTMGALCCMAQGHSLRDTKPLNAEACHAEALKQLLVQKDSVAARNLALEALELDKEHAPSMHLLSRIATDKHMAVEYAESAYQRDTTNHHYRDNYLNALLSAAELDRAIVQFERSIATSDNPQYFLILGMLHVDKGNKERAMAVLDMAEERCGREPALMRLRRQILMDSGRTEEAIAEAQKDVELAPYLADNHIELAGIYAAVKRTDEAIASLRSAIAADNENLEAWEKLAMLYVQQVRLTDYLASRKVVYAFPNVEAKNKLTELGKLFQLKEFAPYVKELGELVQLVADTHPQDAEAQYTLASYLLSIKQEERALEILRSDALKQNEMAAIMLVWYYGDKKEFEKALESVCEALERIPSSIQLWHIKSHILSQLNRHKEIEAVAKEALKHATTDEERGAIYEMLGDAMYGMKRMSRCYAAYEKALECNPESTNALNNYAYFLALEGKDLERALKMITKAVANNNSSPTYLDTHAWVLHRMGRNEEAKRIQQQAISLDTTNHAEFSLHYGDILYALGDTFMAQTYWRKALERGADKEAVEKRFERANREKNRKK